MMLDMGNTKSPIAIKIETATHQDLVSTNWALNLEICDMVNSAQDGPQQAVKALRGRLQQRDDKVVDNVIMLLDTLVKNCGRRFHLLVATRDFMCDLIRLVSPRDPTPQHVKDKALILIERCSDAFANDKDLSAVAEAYQYLKSQHVTFPAQNLDDMVAIHTPRASHSVTDPPTTTTAAATMTAAIPQTTTTTPTTPTATSTPMFPGHPAPVAGYVPQIGNTAAAPGYVSQAAPVRQTSGYHSSGLSHNDLQRLNKELLVVRGNDGVMNDILADLQSNTNPNPEEIHLLKDLNRTCKEMHKRMVELLEQVVEEGLVCQLLDLIDKLNNTFLRYERYEKNLTETATPPENTTPQASQPEAIATPQTSNQQSENIYAQPISSQQTGGTQGSVPQSDGARSSDIQELLSLDVRDAVYTEPTIQHPHDTGTNPFLDLVDAPVSRIPTVTPGMEEQENIYTTSPAKVAPSKPEDIQLSLASNEAGVRGMNLSSTSDEFDMFAQTRTTSLSERVQASGSELAYDAAHDVPQENSLAGAVHARAPVTDDNWLHELNTAEPTTQVMSSEDFDRFLNERAPAPPSTSLSKESKQKDDNLLALL